MLHAVGEAGGSKLRKMEENIENISALARKALALRGTRLAGSWGKLHGWDVVSGARSRDPAFRPVALEIHDASLWESPSSSDLTVLFRIIGRGGNERGDTSESYEAMDSFKAGCLLPGRQKGEPT